MYYLVSIQKDSCDILEGISVGAMKSECTVAVGVISWRRKRLEIFGTARPDASRIR